MLLAFGPTIIVILTFGTGFRLALLLAWRTLLFRKLSGLLLSQFPAIVGIAVIAVVPTLVRRFALLVVAALLLMQARILFTTLAVALFLVLFAAFLLNFRMFPTMFTRFEFTIVTTFELGGTAFRTVLLRLELLRAVVTLLTLVAIATILTFGLKRSLLRPPERFDLPERSPSALPLPFFLRRGFPAGCDCSSVQPNTGSATSPTSSNTSGESGVTSIGSTVSPASRIMRRVLRRWFGRMMVTTSPEWPARAVRPERCRKDFGSSGGSTCTTSSTPETSMPRAATSVATITFTSPELKAARLRSRWFWLRLPCNSAAGMPFCVKSLASFCVWNLVRVNRMRRPLPEARVRTSS